MRRMILGIMLTLLLTSMLAINFNITLTVLSSSSLEPIAGSKSEQDWLMFRHDPRHIGYAIGPAPQVNRTLWKFKTNATEGMFSSPAIEYRLVFVGTGHDGADTNLYALDMSTGEKVWCYSTGNGVWSSPAVADGVVFVNFLRSVKALNATNGVLIWSYDYPTNEVPQFSSLTIADDMLIFGVSRVMSAGSVYALNKTTGAKIWEWKPTWGSFYATPAVAEGRVFIGSSVSPFNLYCLNQTTGAEIWKIELNGIFSSATIVDGSVFLGAWDNKIYCLNATDGTVIWSYMTASLVYSSPAVAYGMVYIGSFDHNIYALNASTGAKIWNFTTGDSVGSSPGIADGKVYLGSLDDNIYCLNATTGELTWSYKTQGDVWSSPVIAYGKVFITSYDGYVYAFSTPVRNIDTGISYHRIQEAIDAPETSDGHTIFVESGTYYENIVVNKSISLVGENRETTIIDGNAIETVINISASNVMVSQFTIQNSGLTGYGVEIFFSNHNTLINNTIRDNHEGIHFCETSNDTLRNNNMTGNHYNFGVSGVSLLHFIHDIDTSNTIDGKFVYYLVNQKNVVVDPSTFPQAGYLGLVNSTNITFKDLNLTNNHQGVLFAYTTNSTLINVNASNNRYGFYLVHCDNDAINGNVINSNYWDGIYLRSCSNITVTGNSLTNNVVGIRLEYFGDNIISGNNLQNNVYTGIFVALSNSNILSENVMAMAFPFEDYGHGIWLDRSNNNIVKCNIITSNKWEGIILQDSVSNEVFSNTVTSNGVGIYSNSSADNLIYHNNFIDNIIQVNSTNSVNIWDNGFPSGGNYWSDYTGVDLFSGPYQNETGSDAIGDTPYGIDADNIDRYPLMNPWTPPDIAVMNVAPSKTVVGQGLVLRLNITVTNQGNKIEAFEITAFANATAIRTDNFILRGGESTSIIFTWNTSGFAKGNYTISAHATPIPGETYTANNNFTDGWVFVTIPGDMIEPLRLVDIYDFTVICAGYDAVRGLDGWYWHSPPCDVCPHNPNFDVNCDGIIDIYDVVICTSHYDQSW